MSLATDSLRIVAIDGQIMPRGEDRISVYDRGFLYGDSVFEVLRTYKGEPFAIEEHILRLRRSAGALLITMPVSDDTLAEEVRRVVALRLPHDSYVRIILTRGSGPMGLDPDLAGAPLRVILAGPVQPPAKRDYQDGIAVCTVRTERSLDGTAAAGAKGTSYVASILALAEAKKRGGKEALIVDSKGRVTEGATSNVFIVAHGVIATPPVSDGILAGITRGRVLATAEGLGIPVELRSLSPDEIATADEVFITSSIREIMPVVMVDGRTIGAGTPGELTRRMHADFQEKVWRGLRDT